MDREAIMNHAEEWAKLQGLCGPAVSIDVSKVQTGNATRGFETGATRSSDAGRYDPEGFLSPIALERFCEYMNKHRVQADGGLRDSDNWQKGMPLSSYMKGMWRHFLHLWQRYRGWTVTDAKAAADAEEDLCALMFNVQGMLHEMLRARRANEGLDRPSERK